MTAELGTRVLVPPTIAAVHLSPVTAAQLCSRGTEKRLTKSKHVHVVRLVMTEAEKKNDKKIMSNVIANFRALCVRKRTKI